MTRKPPSVPTIAVRWALRRFLAMAGAGMAAYWSSCAEQRRCLQSP